MVRRRNLKIAAVLIMLAVAVPSSPLAATGGVGVPGTAPSATTSAATNQRVSLSGDGISVSSHTAVLLHSPLWLSGTVSSVQSGRTVVIQQSQQGSQWTQAGSGTTGPSGSFVIAWRPQQTGQFSLRVALAGSSRVSPPLAVVVYRPSIATLFGPGLWGNHTACGKVLRKTTLGVANRKLACGTRVAIYYRGRTIVVPVIDRGPYSFASWDLTMATASALRMNGTGKIGAVSVASLQ
jgi:rare lipoprotein A